MRLSRLLSIVFIVLVGIYTAASGNYSTKTEISDSIQSPDTVAVADSIAVPNTLLSFSVLQKKYLKTSIITNLIYAGGFGLYYGVVLPHTGRAENSMDVIKLMPLNYLAYGMIFASLPIAVVSSHRAKKNYEYYYKTAPRNFTLPLLFSGVALYFGGGIALYWQTIADYRDNNEIDNSYNKYINLTKGLFTAGLTTFAGTNLYALIYTIVLGEKAKQSSTTANASLYLTPMRYGNANGCLLTWNF